MGTGKRALGCALLGPEGPSCLPESLLGGLLGVRALDGPPGLGEDCREMKAGSLERPPGPGAAEAASSCGDSSSWSKDREGEEGEEGGGEEGEGRGEEEERGEVGEGEEGSLEDRGEPEAAANTRGEEGGEATPAATEVGELGVCLAGRWAAEAFLRERKGSRSMRVGGCSAGWGPEGTSHQLCGTCPSSPGALPSRSEASPRSLRTGW